MSLIIDKPGIYHGLDEQWYHSDPTPHRSLSSTEAKMILDAPAALHHYRNSPRATRPEFDFGSAAHSRAAFVPVDPDTDSTSSG